ncbi:MULTISPECIES: immunity protein [unclassified Desulfovibrio]|uniref:immunity protein n=1 Tax=unclassified Desulfovibrio TaxID=2593640 RepID=UPI002FD906B5
MTTKNNFAMALERAFVELVANRVKERGWKKGEFAAKAWPDDTPKAAAARWTAMRSKASNTGKPQGVQISDAQRMAEVLEEDLSYLLAVAKEQARQQVEA